MSFSVARFRQILEAEGIAGPVGRTSKSLVFNCPACSKKKKLYVRLWDGRYRCWYCKDQNGMDGPIESLLAKLLDIPLQQARERIRGEEGQALKPRIELPEFNDDPETEFWEVFPETSWDWHSLPIDDPRSERGAEYIKSRGVSIEIAKEYDIHYSPIMRQVQFPVKENGRLLGWQGRLVIPHEWIDENGIFHSGLKTWTSPGTPRDSVLMFQDRIERGTHALLGEGPFDAIKGHLCGGNVASMGKTVTRWQLEVLKQKGIDTLYLGLDPDAAPESMKIIRKFATNAKIKKLDIPDGQDLGAMSMEEVLEAFKGAKPVFAWQIFVHFGKPKEISI